jgi:DNA-binding NarL/FixJ family response regulator
MVIQVVLADHHPIFRQGLRTVLESDPRFQVTGEASDGLEAVALVEKLQPGLLITDIMMPSLSGLELVRQLRQRAPKTRSLFFTTHDEHHFVHEAFRNGATGYLLKGATKEQALEAAHGVASGRRYIHPDLTQSLANAYLDRADQSALPDAYDELTAREREILHLVAEGATNVIIADRLFISARTVEIHRANVMRKLSLKTQSELVRYCIKRSIISLDY